jgi:hypothetical protein
MSQEPNAPGSEDAARSARHAENPRENRDALADEARRVQQTLPPDVDATERR